MIRNRIIFCLVVLVTLLSLLGGFAWNRYRAELANRVNVQLLHSSAMDSVEVLVNKNKELVYKNEVALLDVKALREEVRNGNLKHVKETPGIKRNLTNVEAVHAITAVVGDSVSMGLEISREDRKTGSQPDSVYAFHDKFADFEFKPVALDSAILNYQIQVPLTVVVYWQRKRHFIFKSWRFGGKEYFSAITSENPRVRITESVAVQVVKR